MTRTQTIWISPLSKIFVHSAQEISCKGLKNLKLFGWLLLIAFITRLPSLFIDYYNIDEITNSLYGSFIIKGQLSLMELLGNPYLLTHYFNALIQIIAGPYSLKLIHGVHIFWLALTAYFLCLCYRRIKNEQNEILPGVLYLIFSVCFFSKDYWGVLAETLSLLPAVIGACFFFSWVKRKNFSDAFFCGAFIALASLFKAPAGIEICAVGAAMILSRGTRHFFVSLLGLAAVFSLPLLATGHPVDALLQAKSTLTRIDSQYVGAYGQLPFLYWFSKFVVRTTLIALAAFALWIWSLGTLRQEFFEESGEKTRKLNLMFLVLWFVGMWFVVSLGKRVFFHYFVFLFPPLCLLASLFRRNWKISALIREGSWLEKLAVVMGVMSFIAFSSDGYLRWSLNDKNSFKDVASHIQKSTQPDDTIFVWGLLPQIYYFSQREPASTMFWADRLVNFSPGTPAMEYVRSTGGSLRLIDSITRDLTRGETVPSKTDNKREDLSFIGEKELFSVAEMVDKIESAFWRKFMGDVIRKPPVYWVDVSPTGIRSFNAYPFQKYEILRRFVEDNYNYETSINGVALYRLKSP